MEIAQSISFRRALRVALFVNSNQCRFCKCWFFAINALLVSTSVFGKIEIDVTQSPYNAVADDGQDDSAAFQSALNAIKNVGGGRLYIPNGGYRIDTRIDISTNTWAVALEGQSASGVRLFSNSANGVFRFQHSARTSEILLRNFELIANRANAGTAIEILVPPGGVQDKRVVTAYDIAIRYTGGTDSFFNRGMLVTGLFRPLIVRCSFSAPTQSNMSDTSKSFRTTAAFDVSDSYAPVFEECSVSGAHTAYRMHSTGSNTPEDGAFRDCNADFCRVGIHFLQSVGVEPSLWITGCDIRARDYGAFIKNRRLFQFTGNTFRQLSANHVLRDVHLLGSSLGVVLNNTFQGGLSSNRRNIYIDGAGNAIILAGNSLSGTSGSAIEVISSATGIENFQ